MPSILDTLLPAGLILDLLPRSWRFFFNSISFFVFLPQTEISQLDLMWVNAIIVLVPLTVWILLISASWSTLHSSPQPLCLWFRLWLYQISLPYINVTLFSASSSGHWSQWVHERFSNSYHCHCLQSCPFHVACSAFIVLFSFASIKSKPPSDCTAIHLISRFLPFLFIHNTFLFIAFLILLGWYVNPVRLMINCWTEMELQFSMSMSNVLLLQ